MRNAKVFGRVTGLRPDPIDRRRGVEIYRHGMPEYYTLSEAKKLLANLTKAVAFAEEHSRATTEGEP